MVFDGDMNEYECLHVRSLLLLLVVNGLVSYVKTNFVCFVVLYPFIGSFVVSFVKVFVLYAWGVLQPNC